jgi:hypothetical protein
MYTVVSMEGRVRRDVDHLGLVAARCWCSDELKQCRMMAVQCRPVVERRKSDVFFISGRFGR